METQPETSCVEENEIIDSQDQALSGLEFHPQNRRPKKQMNFSSRQEMIRYISNFKIHYKTEFCKNWKEFGYCEFGSDCAYAHGYHELNQRRKHQHKNYKTKMCKQWHETTPGHCTYG